MRYTAAPDDDPFFPSVLFLLTIITRIPFSAGSCLIWIPSSVLWLWRNTT